MRVSFSVFGDVGQWDEYNPLKITSQKGVNEIVNSINKNHLTIHQISKNTSIPTKTLNKLLNSLLNIKAIKKINNQYSLNFPYYTVEDRLLMKQVTYPLAEKIADLLCLKLDDVSHIYEKLSVYKRVDNQILNFSIIGCFFLDWTCLKEFQKENLLIYKKPQNGNREYLLKCREIPDKEINKFLSERLYIASSSETYGKYTLTSFGDSGYRYTIPDFFWLQNHVKDQNERANNLPFWIKDKLDEHLAYNREETIQRVLKFLFSLLEKSEPEKNQYPHNNQRDFIVKMLMDMNYIISKDDVFSLHYPIYLEKDEDMIQEICDLLIPEVLDLVKESYEELKDALSELSPNRIGLDFKEVFGEVWHWVFGQTNKLLVERGVMFDPLVRFQDESRHISWISEFDPSRFLS